MICLVANQVYVGVHDNYYLMAFPDNGAARQLVEEYCTLYVYVKLLVECRVDTCRIQMTVRLMKKLPLNSNDMLTTTTDSSYIYIRMSSQQCCNVNTITPRYPGFGST